MGSDGVNSIWGGLRLMGHLASRACYAGLLTRMVSLPFFLELRTK
jgi:hypothetical protein